MRTAHMIRDKEKLFSMLFMSPTLTTRQIPPLLVSPHFLTLLLHEAEGIDYASQYELLCEILDIFVMKPINWLLLWHHDAMMSQNEQSIIETIVHWFCRLTRKQEDVLSTARRLNTLSAACDLPSATTKSASKLSLRSHKC